MERYGTKHSWAVELGISSQSIHRRLNEVNGISGKNRHGRIEENGFYAESTVRKACADILQVVPEADEQGFVYFDSERYGSIYAWQEELGISGVTLRRQLDGLRGITARERTGRISEGGFFAESVVREVIQNVQHRTVTLNEEGFFSVEEHGVKIRYGTKKSWQIELGIPWTTISRRLEKIQGVEHRIENRPLTMFYLEDNVRSICADLLQDLPRSNEEGFLYMDGNVRYATLVTWERELKVSRPAIERRLKNAQIIGVTARVKTGGIIENGFFAEADVRRVCGDLRTDLPQADESGFLVCRKEEGTERWGTKNAWSTTLGIARSSIESRIQGLQGATARSKTGHIIANGFYAETDIRRLCTDLLEELPQVDETGFFQRSRERFGTLLAWCKELSLSYSAVCRRAAQLKGITGKDNRGKILRDAFYAESEMRKECKYMIQEGTPVADKAGFFALRISEDQTERYGMPTSWAREFGLNYQVVQKRLALHAGLAGKNHQGKLLDGRFYSECNARKACADLIQELPVSGEDGFLWKEKDGSRERYGPVNAWKTELGISSQPIRRRLDQHRKVPIQARDHYNRQWDFYSELDVREVCADLLDRSIPQAEKDGFICVRSEDGVERWGTVQAWVRELKLSHPTIRGRLKNASITGMTGRGPDGQIEKNGFYSDTVVRDLLKDLLRDVPCADENGFFILITEGGQERYGTKPAWAKELTASKEMINTRLQDTKGITGKDSGGKIREMGFFPESIIRSKCADLLVTKLQADASGFFVHAMGMETPERFGSRGAWSRELGISTSAVKRRLKTILGITAKGAGGEIIPNGFFAESDVRKACADLLSPPRDGEI